MYKLLKHPLLLLISIVAFACNSGSDEDKTIASTHPKLEKQLDRDSVNMPVTSSENAGLYERYQITMEEYENSGNYSAGNLYRGKLSQVDEKSHTEAQNFKTALREGMEEGINFAGKYTVVTIGCGTNCQRHFIVDRETGKITDQVQGSMGARYSTGSRVFILNPPDSSANYNQCQDCSPKAYELKDGKLQPLEK